MKNCLFLTPLILLSACIANATTINTFNNQSSFLSAIYPTYYQETFSTIRVGTSLGYSGNGYAYTISDSYGLQTTYGWLQDIATSDILTITFTGGNVTAVGGDFFAVNLLAQPSGSTVTLTFSDGSQQTIASTSSTTSFTGYTFDRSISNLTISAPAGTSLATYRYEALDNLTVGAALPEPGTWMLLATGVSLLAFAKIRFCRR